MSLETYEQARAWAPMIRDRVIRRIMPPWYLDPTIGIQEYKNDYSLSEAEIETLVGWVDAGALEGDPSRLPPPRRLAEMGGMGARGQAGSARSGVRDGPDPDSGRGPGFLALRKRRVAGPG